MYWIYQIGSIGLDPSEQDLIINIFNIGTLRQKIEFFVVYRKNFRFWINRQKVTIFVTRKNVKSLYVALCNTIIIRK